MAPCIITATWQEANILKDINSVYVCGIGGYRAYSKTKSLISKGASYILSVGTAAGLRPNVKAGDIVIPKKIIDHEERELHIDRQLHKDVMGQLKGCGYNIWNEPLIEVDYVISDILEKKRLYEKTGCIAADMESAAIFRACLEMDIPFTCIRAIVDECITGLPQWIASLVDSSGIFSYSRLVKGLILHPWDLTVLLRISIGFFRAKKSLRSIIGRIYPSLPL